MITVHSIIFYLHIGCGSLALVLFWLPIISRKGSLRHKTFGRYYAWSMYAVAFSGAVMAAMVLLAPIQIKGHLLADSGSQTAFVQQIRLLWGFLLYLSLLTYVSVRHGFAVLAYKSSHHNLRHWRYLLPLWVLLAAAVLLMFQGAQHGLVLHIVFGLLGLSISSGMMRYVLNPAPAGQQWLVEHLAAMIGTGIGAHTAFFAFGGRHLFDNLGAGQLIFWIMPGVIGGVAISMLSKKYQSVSAK